MPIIMLKGLPASGKSTYAKDAVRNNASLIRVNKDDLRAMCHDGKWSGKKERHIIAIRDSIVESALRAGLTPIVDDTNLHPKHETRLREIAAAHNTTVEVKFFPIDVDEAIKRDRARPNSVGETVIRQMYRDFLLPAPSAQNVLARPAIIVDVDGTIALKGDRSPYDYSTAGDDEPNRPVLNVINAYRNAHPGTAVIIMSGRDESAREITEQWLKKHAIEWNWLFMRCTGDTRKDAIVKRELYEEFIKDDFFVHAVFDDRDQVVRMWRDELGLTCFQVAHGDF